MSREDELHLEAWESRRADERRAMLSSQSPAPAAIDPTAKWHQMVAAIKAGKPIEAIDEAIELGIHLNGGGDMPVIEYTAQHTKPSYVWAVLSFMSDLDPHDELRNDHARGWRVTNVRDEATCFSSFIEARDYAVAWVEGFPAWRVTSEIGSVIELRPGEAWLAKVAR